MDPKDVETRTEGGKLWFGFPHYVVLGWAVLLSWQVFELTQWRDSHKVSSEATQKAIQESLATLNVSVKELQESTQDLHDSALRTKTILQLRFPDTTRKIEEALSGLEE